MNDCKHCKHRIQKGKYCGVNGLEMENSYKCSSFELDKVTELNVKIGDKVIRYDGLVGKIEKFFDDIPIVLFENGSSIWIKEENLHRFYLIGHTVLGKKATEEELERVIKRVDYKIEELKVQKKQLRKQLWRLKEEMVEDWREWKALRQLRKLNKETQPTEEDTED